MKKISILIILFLLITGCKDKTSTKDIIDSKTCTLIQEDGTKEEYTYTATNDEIDKVKMVIIYDNSMFKNYNLKSLTNIHKEEIKKDILNYFNLDKTSYEGLEITFEFDNQVKVIIDANLNTVDSTIIKKVGLDYREANLGFSDTIKSMIGIGAYCE